MQPLSSLAGIGVLDSPNASSNGSTVVQSRTLPDISLGSLGSSFHSAEEGEYDEAHRGGFNHLPRIPSPDKDTGAMFTSSSQPPPSALLALSPPASTRRGLPDEGHAPRRSRYLRANKDSDDSDDDTDALDARYTHTNAASDDEDGVLGQLSLNVSHRRAGDLRTSYAGGPSKRSGRHSVAANPGPTQMTLREQEQNVDALQKENFNLQLENHFLKERLAQMAPDHIESALKENVKLKIEILNYSKELKKSKKLLMQQDRDLTAAARDRESKGGRARERDAESREMEAMWREEKERRVALEAELDQLRDSDDDRVRQLEEELDIARGNIDDQALEISNLRDAADRAEDEVDKLRAEAKGLTESVGVGKGREARMMSKMEQENAQLKTDLDELRKSTANDLDLMEEQVNELRDKLAGAQIDLDRRDEEIEELNNEVDAKINEHEREIQQVESEWRDEVLEARAQVDELKDVLQEREQDLEDIRKLVLEREEDLGTARERVAELEAAQGETHDRLEETLRNIDMDNAEKEADLVSANREVEALGQKVYDLEELIEELRDRETELNAELQKLEEAYEGEKAHFEELVSALKDARKKTQDERDDFSMQLKHEKEAHTSNREAWESERVSEQEHHRRQLASRDQVNERLTAELEAARDRVAMRDRDLVSVQNALRDVEDQRRKLGDEHSSDQHALELELERLRRDLAQCEDDLDRARDELREREQALSDRDMEVADLMDKHRELEGKLSSERQGRLGLSDKLDSMSKAARQQEREAASLRERLETLEPLLTEKEHSRLRLQKESDQQRQERTELLLRVFKDINRFLGTDDSTTPANFTVFRDTLLQRLRSINGARADFDKRIKDTETKMDQKMASMKRQLDAKWRALDSFEASVKKLELARAQWRSKYSLKDGELEASKARNAELQKEISSLRASSSASDAVPSTQVRLLTERAQTAEKRANQAAQSVAQLEQRLSDIQSRSGQAETKWEARVKEYETRLRAAGEKIKAEKQGGKERAVQLEAQVRDLERQVELTKKRNQRAEGVVATAAHLMDN
ncbi:hypothetical protein Q8F55_000701 [Vanrija albida]|uniref:Centrosomin N-terminal motif 1 domain-containing protein n=1 Tax=Vanrija albida TaxID=181172 RepID=A0ABR3QEH6_9TREE